MDDGKLHREKHAKGFGFGFGKRFANLLFLAAFAAGMMWWFVPKHS